MPRHTPSRAFTAATPAADPLTTPIAPMLAKVAEQIPTEGDWLYEPKWDGFRAIVFRRGREAFIQSRDGKSLDRYFPELRRALAENLPPHCAIDGEIVVAGPHGLDFDALGQRIHPAESRVAQLAKRTPASFVAFDLVVAGKKSVMDQPQAQRREALERLLARVKPPVHLTPMTRDAAQAADWLQRFEGAGLDGVMAKPAAGAYLPGKRAMFKIKHQRSADCVVAGFRWHKSGRPARPDAQEGDAPPGVPAIGSLLLGLYDAAGVLHHVGVTSSFSVDERQALVALLEPLRAGAEQAHPWLAAGVVDGDAPGDPAAADDGQRRPGARSRWTGDRDLQWEPLRPERACEVRYDQLQGGRFRHATTFLRWRDDKPVADCTYGQLEVATPLELAAVFRGR